LHIATALSAGCTHFASLNKRQRACAALAGLTHPPRKLTSRHRCYCLQKIYPLECNRFNLDWEIVMKLIRAGNISLEIPISYKSRDFEDGKKISITKDPPTWLRAWWEYAILKK
jgi:hypothetical protein